MKTYTVLALYPLNVMVQAGFPLHDISSSYVLDLCLKIIASNWPSEDGIIEIFYESHPHSAGLMLLFLTLEAYSN